MVLYAWLFEDSLRRNLKANEIVDYVAQLENEDFLDNEHAVVLFPPNKQDEDTDVDDGKSEEKFILLKKVLNRMLIPSLVASSLPKLNCNEAGLRSLVWMIMTTITNYMVRTET